MCFFLMVSPHEFDVCVCVCLSARACVCHMEAVHYCGVKVHTTKLQLVLI